MGGSFSFDDCFVNWPGSLSLSFDDSLESCCSFSLDDSFDMGGVGEGALFFPHCGTPRRSFLDDCLALGDGVWIVERENAGNLLNALIASGDNIMVNLRDTQTSSSKVSSSSTASSMLLSSMDEVVEARDMR